MALTDPGDSRPPEPEPKRPLIERVRSLFGGRREASLRADLEGALAQDQTGGTEAQAFSPEERAMLRNILGLREVRVADVAVPRADIVAVEEGLSLAELLETFRDAAHSRLPVYRDTLDDPIGMVHIRDVLAYLTNGSPKKTGSRKKTPLDLAKIDLTQPLAAAKITRQVLFVPPSMPALDLLVQMQATRIHIALVIDEYGGTDGLCSIEDLIEQVIGDIEDEHDVSDEAITATPEGFVASARASLDDVRAALGNELALLVPDDVADEVDTLGGLIATLAGRVPARGELVRGPGDVEFEILDADPRRVKRIRIRRARPAPPAPETVTRSRRARDSETGSEPTSGPSPDDGDGPKA